MLTFTYFFLYFIAAVLISTVGLRIYAKSLASVKNNFSKTLYYILWIIFCVGVPVILLGRSISALDLHNLAIWKKGLISIVIFAAWSAPVFVVGMKYKKSYKLNS